MLAQKLANVYGAQYIPEYARGYVERLTYQYSYQDVETIAGVQVEQYLATRISSDTLFIFDTWLIITKTWFKWVFKKTPDWLDDHIRDCPIDFFLLCKPDLPWVADSVRENGGENRLKLYEEYKSELINYGFPFAEIGGVGDERLYSAIEAIRKFSKDF